MSGLECAAALQVSVRQTYFGRARLSFLDRQFTPILQDACSLNPKSDLGNSMPQRTRSMFKAWYACFAGAIAAFMLTGPASAASSCPSGLLPSSYREDAAQVKDIKTRASIGLKPGSASVFTVSVLSAPASVTGSRYAAFYMPPSIVESTLRVSVIMDLERAANTTDTLPKLKNTHGSLLLVPLDPNDCSFYFMATPELEPALQVGSLRHIDAAAITDLLDGLYRSNWPTGPAVNDIESNGIDDPAAMFQFAVMMQMPIVVSDVADALRKSAPVAANVPADAPGLPETAAWRFETGKFAWPASLKTLESQAAQNMKVIVPIISKPVNQKSRVELEAELPVLHGILSDMQKIGSIAMADMEALKTALPTTADQQTLALQDQMLAVLDRFVVVQFSALVSLATSQYEKTYAKLYEVPKLSAVEPFDASNLLKYAPKGVVTVNKLTTLTTSDLSRFIPKAPKELDAGQAYLVFADYKDPVTQQALLRPEFTIALKGEAFTDTVNALLLQKIPSNSCERRIDHAPIKWDVDRGSLVGSMDARVELWACVRHTWVCFKSWKPKFCKNEIKTFILKTHGTVKITVTAFPKPEGISLLYTSDVPYVGPSTNETLIPLDISTLNDGKTDMQWRLTQAFFTQRAGNSNLVAVMLGTAPPLDAFPADVKWKALSDILNNETVKKDEQ